MFRKGIATNRLAALVSAWVAASLTTAQALEPFPPAAVDEWIGALKGGHASFDSITTDRMMLSLSKSERLKEVCEFLQGENAVSPAFRERIGLAMSELDGSGHSPEVSEIDEELFAQSPRLRWTPETLAAALRLTEAGRADALVRMAETLMLVPSCDRTKAEDDKEENLLYVRGITFPTLGQVSIPRAPELLPLLKQLGALGRFRKLAEERVATAPEDFTSLRALTLATLLDTGDNPALWSRIKDTDSGIGNYDFVRGCMELCYEMRLPVPHLCAFAEKSYQENRPTYYHNYNQYGPLLTAALWMDLGEMDNAKRCHARALDSLSLAKPEDSREFLSWNLGTLVLSLGDVGLLAELDRWLAHFTETSKDPNLQRGEYYRFSLTACEWALAWDLPEPVIDRWFRFAGKISDEKLRSKPKEEYPESGAMVWHYHLLMSAKRYAEAGEILGALTRSMEGKDRMEGLERLRSQWEDHQMIREPFVIHDPAGGIIRSTRWTHSNPEDEASRTGAIVADVYERAGVGEDLVPQNPGEKNPGAGHGDRSSVSPAVEGGNLLPATWRWHRGKSYGNALPSWDCVEGTVQIGYRGTFCHWGYELHSGIFPVGDRHDYIFSGRIRAFGSAEVALRFLGPDGKTLSTELVTQKASGTSPGERWFRINLLSGEVSRGGLQVPPEATSAKVVLITEHNVHTCWSDLFVGRLAATK